MPNSPVLPTQNQFSPACPNIILASTSPFRQQLLQKLHLPFDTAKPEVDETRLENESVKQMVQRLSRLKAEAVANQSTEPRLVIGSDQSAVLNGEALGKPHSFKKAFEQLKAMQGQTIYFYTGLCVVDTQTGKAYEALDTTEVVFRRLSDETLKTYLEIEQPLNCAGSFKSEGLGITLFEAIHTQDPNALIGLPLIQLTTILNKIGYELPIHC